MGELMGELFSSAVIKRADKETDNRSAHINRQAESQPHHSYNQTAGGEGRRGEGREASVLWREPKIHLPQLINEEAIADEFSNWEQVS